MIVKVGPAMWILFAHSGKPLGTHRTKKSAKRQETAISLSKARAAGHKIPRKRK